MRQRFGESRSRIRTNHALMSADSHERTTLSNWPGSDLAFVIAPQMGARFSQYFVWMPAGATGSAPLERMERFFFVLDGGVTLQIGEAVHELSIEGYAFLPAGQVHRISARGSARLIVLERPHVPLPDTPALTPVIGDCSSLTARPMKGDPMVMLKKLLPEDPAFDCEVNTMDFAPGGSLPYVETHFMEHGLLFLNGGGVYRLDEDWYPVEADDVIWMGPFCPQWFGAIGPGRARYLIYKNWNRDPHSF